MSFIKITAVAFSVVTATHALPAFPGAEGFGSQTVGGRGGRVIEVTNLNDAGVGSLRAACEASGPRIVVFRTGGLISLRARIHIANPYITIAGQTAPGDGICIRGAQISVNTHDVVIRYIRSRAGDNTDYNSGVNPDNRDAFEIQNSSAPPYNIIFDHCSASWGVDETMSTWFACRDITIQWCIIAEGLHNSLHSSGAHSKGLLIGEGARNISIHHNLFACNWERNPLIKGGTTTEVINNVMYNWGGDDHDCVYLGYADQLPSGADPVTYTAVVRNFMKRGINSYTQDWAIRSRTDVAAGSRFYMLGNIGPGRPDDSRPEFDIMRSTDRSWCVSSSPFTMSGITTWPAAAAYDSVLARAGATIPSRDTVDRRIVGNVRNGTGRIIDSQSDVGGWPSYGAGVAPVDTDRDGMPDSWERNYGFNPSDPSDGALDANGNGYTNVEEFLNQTDPRGATPSAPVQQMQLRSSVDAQFLYDLHGRVVLRSTRHAELLIGVVLGHDGIVRRICRTAGAR